MRIQSFLLLVALLALGSQVPAASGRRKGEKHGGCPPDDKPCLSVPDQCTSDSQCSSGKKCCPQACFRQCVPRVLGKCPPHLADNPSPKPHGWQNLPGPCVAVKPGSCPKDQLRCLSPVKHLCSCDSDCPRGKRCCPGACGRDCRNPTRGTTPGVRGPSTAPAQRLLSCSTSLAGISAPKARVSQNYGNG
ncbi:WAP four-disulfide core domain protein 5 [Fukomys damarensis]|uniref:WAP four-disulfide core domain protein 5 n=1 Tax=Fukomys damarensis TaxID=885580 RepID=A0A091E5A0_FUKDA|nr:WAP four-disulfide core domain protein 5 [Fukomys damarensis]